MEFMEPEQPTSNSETAMEVQDVSKTFIIPHEKVSSLKGHATRLFRRIPKTRFQALDDVSVKINKGEFFSIIGENGSGKSTLLKLLAGIYQPSSGSIKISGSITTLIELGVGFNFELSGRDNVFLNGSIIGLTKKQIEEKFDEIVRFAEVGDFIDQKIKNYSSGMQVRLAFAIAIQANADIFIVDEVLAVGDANFQQKCFDVFREFKSQNKTIVFVSHDLTSVRDFSDRVMVLHQGKSYGVHHASEGLEIYRKLTEDDSEPETKTDKSKEKRDEINTSLPHIAGVQVLGADDKPLRSVSRGDPLKVALTINNPRKSEIAVGVSIARNDGLYCFGTNTFIEKIKLPTTEQVTVEFSYPSLALQKGSYYFIAGVFSANGYKVYEMRHKAARLRINQKDNAGGVVYLEHTWNIK